MSASERKLSLSTTQRKGYNWWCLYNNIELQGRGDRGKVAWPPRRAETIFAKRILFNWKNRDLLLSKSLIYREKWHEIQETIVIYFSYSQPLLLLAPFPTKLSLSRSDIIQYWLLYGHVTLAPDRQIWTAKMPSSVLNTVQYICSYRRFLHLTFRRRNFLLNFSAPCI